MKATLHCGKTGSADHNDRQFDPKTTGDHHIDPERMSQNVYRSYKNITPFAEAEKQYYKDHYMPWVKMQNKKYLAHREKNKLKSINKLLNGKNTRPDEIILQIGNHKEHPDGQVFADCVDDFIKSLAMYATHFHILDIAVHNDEATPHAHIRAIWDYTDKDGIKKISQGEALKQLNIELPDPELEESRYNNRKMTFQNEIRNKWYDICQEHGFEIDRIPDQTNQMHLTKNQVIIRDQERKIEELQEQLTRLEKERMLQQQELERLEYAIKKRGKQLAQIEYDEQQIAR